MDRLLGGSDGDNGRVSAVLRLEHLSGDAVEERAAAAVVSAIFPQPVYDPARGDTAHVYVSADQSAALANHTDVTDVLALQVSGRKAWTVCEPVQPPNMGSDKYGTCSTYDAGEMDGLPTTCEQIELHPGDLLYWTACNMLLRRAPGCSR